jgi:hypothetical protein
LSLRIDISTSGMSRSNLGHNLARGTIANILKQHGIEPAPERSRKTNWKEFLNRHWELIVAADVFTIEAWIRHGARICRCSKLWAAAIINS